MLKVATLVKSRHGFFSMLRHSLKPWEIAVFTVYFDDSGTHSESETAVAACLVASDKAWESLTLDWGDVCVEEGFEHFHMTDFIGRHKLPYSAWDDEKRDRVYRKLAALIGKYIERGYSVTVQKSAFVTIAPETRAVIGDKPYTLAVRTCIGNMRKWRVDSGGNFQFVFDWISKGNGKGEIKAIHETLSQIEREEYGLTQMTDGWSCQHKQDFPPLQAADIFAWNVYNATVNRVIAREARPSRWLVMLRDYVSQPLSIGVFDESQIQSFNRHWE